jgi:hypothetical protein
MNAGGKKRVPLVAVAWRAFFYFLVRSPIWLFESAKQPDREWKSK